MQGLARLFLVLSILLLTACVGAGHSDAPASRSGVEMYGVIDVGVGHSEVR